jgi:hypothetical protein
MSMKSIEEVGTFRRTQAPCTKAPAKVRHSPAVEMELRVLRLAADAADIRRDLTPEQAKCPNLTAALDACEALFDALGWGDNQAQSNGANGSGH